ncbi:MAG: hypothetical protein HQ522_09450 [Bacteroidetes bacterium]|nr:hypothetical protein [Bacteroidota bacterium]
MIPKRILFGLISLFILITSACQKEETPSCNYPKNAKLKRVVVCGYIESECPTRECDDIIKIEEEYEYDSKGRLKKVLISPKYEDGVLTNPIEYHLYEYNSKDQLVKIESYSKLSDGYWHDKNHIYTYSDDGKMIKENIEIMEVGNQYKLYKYTNNRLTRIEYYELDSDELEFYILLEYDDSGNLIKETAFDKNGELFSYFQRNVFENGVIIPSYLKIWGYTKLDS